MITLKQLKSKLEKDFGWENLDCDENKWFVDELIKDTIQAIDDVNRCTEMKTGLKVFNSLIETIVVNNENNTAKITDVKLWAEAWREEMNQELTLTDIVNNEVGFCKCDNKPLKDKNKKYVCGNCFKERN